ncbi:hypothetical protein [Halospina sp. K52047b]|uniref:hypothetical protein n=1 Tax=Halospina sp. K52047b TaxID=2614160 RepID=UPI00124AE2A9|nr:hypothetical protein [Halospina sp. K52047b]KAA8980819.1 hypothetical protein F3089_11475 [Halospina sp. K52047b]
MMVDKTTKESNPLNEADPKPEITWWVVLICIALLVLIGLCWWYFLPRAYDGLLNDLYRPIVSSGPIVTVQSFHLALPLLVFGLLSVFAMAVLGLAARPLNLTQRRVNELFRPFLWIGLVGVIFGVLSQPLAFGISSYLEGAGYYQCPEHTRISPFTSTRVLVHEPELCNRG